jgi:2-polyprenyl-3-methyl-5-hydroxy-6-metoxy-1,4-benzoquinol methylase
MTIPPEKDPMGTALLDYLNGNHEENITVKSSITEDDVIPVNYLFRDFEEMPGMEQKALKLCKGKVLDVGAGSGSHSLYLQKNDIEVTGIDISESACRCCTKRGVKNIANDDFFELPSNQRYDTLLMMMNGIGFVGSVANLDIFFLKAKQLLTSGGQIILDSSDIKYMFEDEDEEIQEIFYGEDEAYYGEVTYLMEYKNITGEPFRWLFADPDLLKTKAEKFNFKFEKLIDGSNNDYLARLTLLC